MKLFTQRLAARRARREYQAAAAAAAGIFATLYGTEDPAARAELMRQHVAAELHMASLHEAGGIWPSARVEGGTWRPMTDILGASATFFALAAEAEHALTLSEWAPVAELEAGTEFLHGNSRVHVLDVIPNEVEPHLLHVVYDDGEMVVLGAGDTVRVAGPDHFRVGELARECGATFAEGLEWYHLATTRDRDHRAELFGYLAELAGPRVGETAAGSLLAIGDSEAHVACDPGGPVPSGGLVMSHEAGR